MTIYDFINMATDDYYKINVFYLNTGNEILHQVEVGNIEKELQKIGCYDLLDNNIVSWDISEENNNEFTINIE